MKAACCIENHNIKPVLAGMLNTSPGDIHRVLLISHGENRNPLLLAINFQLLNRCRPIDIAGHQERFFTLLLELAGNLGRRCGLTGTLETSQKKYGYFIIGKEDQLCGIRPHKGLHLFLNNLNHHLSGIQAGQDILAYCPFLD